MTALFVIDMQRDYMEKYESGLLGRVNERIRKAVGNNELIVCVRNIGRRKGEEVVFDYADGLLLKPDYEVKKSRSSVFSDLALLDMLKSKGVTECGFIGIDGCCCVASSACDAAQNGFAAKIELKYIGVQNPTRFEKKKITLEKLGVIIE